jgi:ATP-binding cassette subfamily B protein AbcA/BmrA
MVIGVFIVGLTLPFCYVMLRKTGRVEQVMNAADDKASQVGAESLSQVQFIRASFMSNAIRELLHTVLLSVTQNTVQLWMIYALVRGVFIITYIISLGVVLGMLLWLIKAGSITSLYATTIIAMYLRAARKMFKLDQIVKTLVTSYRRIKDFYTFVDTFGAQTFPVLAGDAARIVEPETFGITRIQLCDVSFKYSEKRVIFNDISCDVSVDIGSLNKLYGIIGPSGVGKTTFLSLVGGQLKPSSGIVLINGCDIYMLDDNGRKKLIALQGQMATHVRGTLRYNLLFGLPENRNHQDAQLVSLLRSVGLWYIFEYEFGLETLIGEGGLNLSGGQRQRLNFANLYLRAQYYKPALILIDEPTSSLDELSEAAITQMITVLAEQCVTFVIAHRLKTLEDAHKILDFSLVERDKGLVFYTREELLAESEYYQQLVSGVRTIEE